LTNKNTFLLSLPLTLKPEHVNAAWREKIPYFKEFMISSKKKKKKKDLKPELQYK
jgi:hypothetical protein